MSSRAGRSNKSRRKEKSAKRRNAKSAGDGHQPNRSQAVLGTVPALVGVMPGVLMFRAEPPLGVPETDTLRTRQLSCLKDSSHLATIPERNRSLLIESLARTLGRAEYHRQRFKQLRSTLDDIRDWAPGEVFWSGLLSCMHYELQGLAGAARLMLDELLLVIALRHDPNLTGNQERKWAASNVFNQVSVVGSSLDVPEVHRLRSHQSWFALVNAYRNAFFHAGSQHGSGHYDADAGNVVRNPARNGLLVPDQSSLSLRPYDWTWNNGTTVDDVANGIYDELVAVVGEICEAEWGTPLPAPGKAPQSPNLFVTMIKPIAFVAGDRVIIPFFTSREKAESFMRRSKFTRPSGSQQPELVRIRSSQSVVGEEALSFSVRGLEQTGLKRVLVYLDPTPRDPFWQAVNAASSAEASIEDVSANDMEIMSMPVDKPMSAYLWRTPFNL